MFLSKSFFSILGGFSGRGSKSANLSQRITKISFAFFLLISILHHFSFAVFFSLWICRVFHMFCVWEVWWQNASRFCFVKFYLKIRLFEHPDALLFLEQNCGTIFTMIRDILRWEISIAKHFFFWVLSIPVKSGWSFVVLRRCKGERGVPFEVF